MKNKNLWVKVLLALPLMAAAGTLRADDWVSIIRENCSGYSNCYTSLSAWEADFGGVSVGTICAAGNLVCAQKNAVAQIEGSWTNADTTAVSINGWTTSSTTYIRIFTTGDARHDGKWDTTAYRLQNTATPLEINEENVRIDGLQIYMNDTSYAQWRRGIFANLGTLVSDIRISNSIVRANGDIGNNAAGIWFDTTGSGSKFFITNTLIYGFKTNGDYAAGVRTTNGNWTGHIYSVTANYNDYGFRNNGGAIIAKNCYAGGNTHAAYNGTIPKTNCASSDGTGSVGYTSIAYSTSAGAAFTSLSLGGEDYHIKSNSSLKDAGIDTSTGVAPLDFITDIDGNTRSAPWDIGADEGTSGTDTVAPSTPTNFNAVAVSSTQINLSWTASTDNVGVTYYKIKRDSVQITTTSSTSYSDMSLTPATTYSYTVNAYDAVDNQSGTASASTRTLNATDSTPPSQPGAFTATAVSTGQINLSWSASSDNVAVVKYWLFRDTVHIATITSGTSYANGGLAASTSYSYGVRALDAANNESSQATASTTTLAAPDATNPTVAISTPANSQTISGTFNITGTAADNISVSKVEIKIDAGSYVNVSGLTSWSYSLDTTGLSNGNHTITARATDTSSNTATVAVTVNISNAAPSPTFNKRINVQGKLTDVAGNPISGPKIVTFRLYTSLTGGASVWADTIGLNLTNGLFNIALGQNASLDSVPFNQALYLGMHVAGDASEMVPRQLLGASAYALGSVGDFNAAKSVYVAENAVINGTIRGASWGFGGTYTVSVSGCGSNVSNPLTSAASCPSGFSPYMAGSYKNGDANCVDQLYICMR